MNPKPYALIGAGPMGLATARQLQRYGIPFEGFELHSDVGGLWDIDNPHSTMYESAHLISSKHMTEFTEFPMHSEAPTYPKHSDIRQYFQQYSEHFNLKKYFNFDCKVTSITPTKNDQWQVDWSSKGQEKSAVFAGVLIANGNLHKPNVPQLPGSFDGEVLHSCEYRSPERLKDKRVLILGCGNSACDIAVDAVHYAKSVDISVRRGYYFLPKFVLGKPIDSLGGKNKLPKQLKSLVESLLIKLLVGKPSDYGLPDPDYKMYESHPVINSLALHHLGHGDIKPRKDIQKLHDKTVTFTDNKQEEYDLILLATGYKLDFPFIDHKFLNWKQNAPDLFLNVFNPSQKNLFVMGMIEAAGLGWQGRAEQAQLVAMLLKLKTEGQQSTVDWFEQQISASKEDVTGGMNYLKVARMAYYVHKQSYLDSLHKYTQRFKTVLSS